MSETSPMSKGKYRVGVNFNPGGHEQVTHIKQVVADLIDYIDEHGANNRCTSLCQTALEDAAMWGVKSVTKPEKA